MKFFFSKKNNYLIMMDHGKMFYNKHQEVGKEMRMCVSYIPVSIMGSQDMAGY